MNLNDKRTIIIVTGAMFLVLFFSFQLVVNPAREKIAKLDKKIDARKKGISELSRLKKEYKAIQSVNRSMEMKISKTAKNVTLPSLLEDVATDTELKDKMTGLKAHETIKSKNFQESGVEISLKEITLDELLAFVYNLESLPYMIKIKGFKIKTTYGEGPKHINLTLLVSLFTPT